MAARRHSPELKLLMGAEPRRMVVRNPTAPSGEPTPPEDLSEAERAVWDHLVEELRLMNMLSSADRIVLAELARMTVLAQKLHATLAAQSGYTVEGNNGFIHIHPVFTALNNAQRQVLSFTTALGLTPIGRSRITGQAASKPNTEAAHTPDLYAI